MQPGEKPGSCFCLSPPQCQASPAGEAGALRPRDTHASGAGCRAAADLVGVRRLAEPGAALSAWLRQRTSIDVCQLLQRMAPCTHIQSLRTIAPALPPLSKFYPNYVMWPMLTQNHTGQELGTVAAGWLSYSTTNYHSMYSVTFPVYIPHPHLRKKC